MSVNGYELAFEQAKAEHNEIRAKIEELHTRSALIEKLLESLKPFMPEHHSVEESHHSSEDQAA